MGELQKGSGDSTKSFDFFKSQIEKLTDQMVQLEKESSQWKEKSDVSLRPLSANLFNIMLH